MFGGGCCGSQRRDESSLPGPEYSSSVSSLLPKGTQMAKGSPTKPRWDKSNQEGPWIHPI